MIKNITMTYDLKLMADVLNDGILPQKEEKIDL